MARRVWFCSDPHFGHEKIIKLCRPQFSDVEEMNEHIVDRWCSTVRPNDLVYCLGDFAWRTRDAIKWRRRLTGTIRLVVGNHDDLPGLAAAGLFQRMQLWRHFDEYGFTATHIPLRREQIRHDQPNVHGHVHGAPGQEYFHHDVSMEAIDYTPVAAEVLSEWARSVSL